MFLPFIKVASQKWRNLLLFFKCNGYLISEQSRFYLQISWINSILGPYYRNMHYNTTYDGYIHSKIWNMYFFFCSAEFSKLKTNNFWTICRRGLKISWAIQKPELLIEQVDLCFNMSFYIAHIGFWVQTWVYTKILKIFPILKWSCSMFKVFWKI